MNIFGLFEFMFDVSQSKSYWFALKWVIVLKCDWGYISLRYFNAKRNRNGLLLMAFHSMSYKSPVKVLTWMTSNVFLCNWMQMQFVQRWFSFFLRNFFSSSHNDVRGFQASWDANSWKYSNPSTTTSKVTELTWGQLFFGKFPFRLGSLYTNWGIHPWQMCGRYRSCLASFAPLNG